MPIVFGEPLYSIAEFLAAFTKHGDQIRGIYRATYRYERGGGDPYNSPVLERPASLAGNPSNVIFPWEQIFLAAAACAGSDYPALAAFEGIPLERTELVVAGVFDPRGVFDGLGGFRAPANARHCYQSLHLHATLVSSAPRADLERLHARVISRNMVLDGLRGVPKTDELVVSAG